MGTPSFWWMTVIPFVALLSGLTLLGIVQGVVVVIMVQAMLAELGASCVVAANGIEALAQLDAERFDVVFMDMQMPELDGLEATRRWRAIEASRSVARVPIVAVTTNAEREQGAACRAPGTDGFMSKPSNMHTLATYLATRAQRTVARPASLESGL